MVKYIYIYIYIYTHTHHIFIHLSIDGQLDCFHILASVNMVRERGVVQTAFGDDDVVFRFFLEHNFFQTLLELYYNYVIFQHWGTEE